MAKPLIKPKKIAILFSNLIIGDTFFAVEDRKDQRLCMRCDPIHDNDGNTVVWNAVNLATGELTYFKDNDLVRLVNIEIEVGP